MKKEFKTLIVKVKNHTAWIVFNRPEVHNAFNSVFLSEVQEVLEIVKNDPDIRVAVLTGEGKSFCSGADLNWMREIVNYSFEENLKETFQLADVMHSLYTLPKPTIAMINGAAIGGGTGFLSACDIAVASDRAKFGLSEVQIGLVPAAISPYVIRRVGESRVREYFLTGKRFRAEEAREIGLVNQVVPHEELKERVDELIDFLLMSGPEAIANCKRLIQNVPRMNWEEAKEFTARMIAELRISEEGQEGMASFLERRKPKWAVDKKNNKK